MTIAAMIRTRFDCAIPGTPVRYALGTQQAGKKPTRANSRRSPRIRSERPAFELHYPHMADRMRAEAHVGRAHGPTPATTPATGPQYTSRT
jgi:hypothetical protein